MKLRFKFDGAAESNSAFKYRLNLTILRHETRNKEKSVFEKNSSMVRYQSSDSDSSTEDSSSSTDFSQTSSSEDESPNNANNHKLHLRYEESSDGGRDHCECSYDYRGELDEIFCPRCRKEVIETYDDDEDENWYFQQPTHQPTTQLSQQPISLSIKTRILPRESDDSFDSWPSADEEEIVNNNGQMESFRLCKIVKADLEYLTGCGLVTHEDYNGDLDENVQQQKKRRKRMTKKKYEPRR